MRTTFNVAYYCRESKVDKNGFAAVEVSLSVNGERRFFNLPMKAEPKVFNKKRRPEEIDRALAVWRKKIEEAVTDMLEEGEPLTADNLRRTIQTGGIKIYTLSQLFDDHKRLIRTRRITEGAIRKYEIAKDMMIDYFGDVQAASLKTGDLSDFYTFIYKKYKTNSAASYMAKIKSVFRYAMDNGKIKKTPFAGIVIKREKKNIEYLNDKEIEKIRTTEFSTEALNRIRDVFMVQMYTGLSFIDLERLKEEDIKEKDGVYFIHKQRTKTGIYFTSVIIREGIDILQKYGYKLPIISNQKTNSALKAIGREAGINKTMHTHLGRKTYGHLLLQNGVRIETVAKALGHSDVKTTQRYYTEITEETTIKEISSMMKQN